MTERLGSSGQLQAVTDRRQARLLTDPRSAAFIHPFLGRERSTAEAAREAGCALTTMAYRIRVLHQAGLLRIVRTHHRPGRPISYYRSTQDAYRVPLAATDFADQRDQTHRIGAPIYRRITDAYSAALASSGSGIRLITRDDHGGIYSTDLPPHRTPDHHPLMFEDRTIELTVEQAERLCAQLDRLIDELPDRDDRTGKTRHSYAVMVAAVPLKG
ncbi:Helix-turn-helix domain-containing protein [Friedmanniella luteola]|uniref:Helix-turn-helix domain-containing protein n=1 Tax=Friedmanniella luteola TaxID=546871 RepID=A0A1H1SVZ8_9ACTN|nr:helix-turn-helix domain-containing protein [Friedmanniella luteola]SDS51896.1 Helix-turn-helix domain-containing protein [Friedmanniella luteola]